MKVMAGAKPEAKPDYRAQTLTELSKLQGKVVLLNEMLDNVDSTRGERFAAGDAYHQVSLLLVQARPKIQKWIGDAEADDAESLETFLQMNDQINHTLNRYEAFKRGDYTAAANPIPSELAPGKPKSDLIDLLDDEPAPAVAAPVGPVNELADLFGPPSSSAQPQTPPDARASVMAAFQTPGAIALPGTPTPQQQQALNPAFTHAQAAIWGGTPPASSPSIWGTPTAAPVRTPQFAQAQMQWGQAPVQPARTSQQAAPAPAPAQQQQPPKKDPFADLEGLF